MELEYKVQEDKEFNRWVLRVGIFRKETWVFEEWGKKPTPEQVRHALFLFERSVECWEYFNLDRSLKLVEFKPKI